jgi:hypothetical protein
MKYDVDNLLNAVLIYEPGGTKWRLDSKDTGSDANGKLVRGYNAYCINVDQFRSESQYAFVGKTAFVARDWLSEMCDAQNDGRLYLNSWSFAEPGQEVVLPKIRSKNVF